MNIIKKYWENVYLYRVLYTPIACTCAGIYYTICWVHNMYPNLSVYWVIAFDVTHFIYLIFSLYFIYQKEKCEKAILSLVPKMKVVVTISLAIQFNMIIHLFPSRYAWACVFVFLMPISFFLDFHMMLINSIIYVVSLTIGHICHSEEFLPLDTPHYRLVLLYQVIVVLIAIVFSLTLTYFSSLFLKRTQLEEEENNFLMEKQLEYYEQLNNMDQELRRFRHDIKNHFMCLQALLEKGQINEAMNYFEDLQSGFKMQQNMYFSGNVVIDSILNYQLKKIEIQPVIYGKLSEITAVSPMDLCTVFSNMLSNAVCAVTQCKVDVPQLIIRFEHGEHFFSITIINSSEQRDINEPHTKQHILDKNHGHGIHQIESIVEKYNGIFEQSSQDGLFSSIIYLPIHEVIK